MTLDDFLARWLGNKGGAERSNSQMFLRELVDVLDLPIPAPAAKGALGDYEFEATLTNISPFGRSTKGFIDLYRRGHFILEAKQSQVAPGEPLPADPAPLPEPPAFDLFGNPVAPAPRLRSARPAPYDRLMRDAFDQARGYAFSLPGDHKSPPFLIVADIGRAFEIYFDWTDNGRGYHFFPHSAGYRITLEQLREHHIQKLLRAIWTDPRSIDPRLEAVDVTREVARSIAEVSRRLVVSENVRLAAASEREKSQILEETTLFIIRLLFSMFAEDVGLIRDNSFTAFLKEANGKSHTFWRMGLDSLWRAMGDASVGRYWPQGDTEIRYFNGNLFADRTVYDLGAIEKAALLSAAGQRWDKVEPAIFGTFLEQAFEQTTERERLGAHYTPRAYVERLVEATVMDVLRPEWEAALMAARAAADAGDTAAAIAGITAFHARLAAVRILDPACGTGNFLFVALEMLLKLEAELLVFLASLDAPAEPLVGPAQFLGLELNPRAAVIAEITVWIGWLRFRMNADPARVTEPILRQTAAINFGRHYGHDACLALNEFGSADLEAPRESDWPEAEFIVGNPPFIGKGANMRAALGDGYVAALRAATPSVASSADFVMQWWDRAARHLLAPGTALKRFGFVTTNSITQSFNRRVIAQYLAPSAAGALQGVPPPAPPAGSKAPCTPDDSNTPTVAPHLPAPAGLADEPGEANPPPLVGEGDRPKAGGGGTHLSLTYAIPDHPWTRATRDAAAVRIAMTVAEAGTHEGRLLTVTKEAAIDTDTPEIETAETQGHVNADLTVGADVTKAVPLRANSGLSCNGMMLAGQGFKISRKEAEHLMVADGPGSAAVIRPYIGGSELLQGARDEFVIDFAGLTEAQARQRHPAAYQNLLVKVKPERDRSRDRQFKSRWWLFGRIRPEIRRANEGLSRYIATTETAKHRIFRFLPVETLPDHMVISIGSDSAFHLGVLSSRIHAEWALDQGGTLEDRPRYNKTLCFDPFPFPAATPAQEAAIAAIAEEIEQHRAEALAEHPALTLTAIYNHVEALRAGNPLTAQATASRAAILQHLHDQLDAEVAAAYGWPWPLAPADIVARLVALNAERAAEEKAGHVRWLRRDYQAKNAAGSKAAESAGVLKEEEEGCEQSSLVGHAKGAG